MSRPSVRRALRRAGLEPGPRPARPSGPRNRGVAPEARIWLVGESPASGPVDFRALFGRSAPVEMEIGVGRALFLLAEAAARPDTDFFGIELQREYARIAMAKAAAAGLSNVRVEPLDGKAFLAHRLAPCSLTRLHVYFPDPWPKKRHHKRRLVDAAFAAAAARALVPGGEVLAASDHASYWACIDEAFDGEALLERASREEIDAWTPGTHYARKAAERGIPIGRGIWRRPP